MLYYLILLHLIIIYIILCFVILIILAKTDGLCTQLTKACPKEPEPVPFKDIEVERGQLRLEKKLGAGNFGEVFAGKQVYDPF